MCAEGKSIKFCKSARAACYLRNLLRCSTEWLNTCYIFVKIVNR